MSSSLSASYNPLSMQIIAHRGASTLALENSSKAFEIALAQGVYGIEFDVHFVNGQALILHDTNLMRTHHVNIPIHKLRPKHLTEYQILTLHELLTLINNQCLVNIELKSTDNLSELITSLQELWATGLIDANTVISSFDHCLLDACQHALPDCQFGGLIGHLPKDLAQYAVSGNFDIVAVASDIVNKALVDDAHANGKRVWVYTVDDLEEAKIFARWQVDAIFTNQTDTMLNQFR